MEALIAAHVESGARPLLLCDSGWADEQHPGWGITAFPDLDSRVKLYRMMNEFGYYRNNEGSFTLLGTAMEEPKLASIQPEMIYSLWIVPSNPYADATYGTLSKEAMEDLWKKHNEAFERSGGCSIIICNSYWANDAYRAFGVEAHPSLEKVQEFKAELEKLNWPRYIPGISILGTLSPMQAQLPSVFR